MSLKQPDPLHILLLPSWYPDSPDDVKGVFFRDQALALASLGHRVGVLAPRLKSLRSLFSGSKALSGYQVDEGLFTYRQEVLAALPRLPYGNYLLLKRAALKLFARYVLAHGKPDIIHAHAAIFGGAIATGLGKAFGIPVVITEHSSGFARSLYKRWQIQLAATAFSEAVSCIAVSPSLGQLLEAAFPIPKGGWKWIPNVVSDRFCSGIVNGANPRSVRFLNLALMTENKGQFDLLKAFHQIREDGLDAELWLAGDGVARSELGKLALELAIEDRVRFLGLVNPEHVPKLLGTVDVMVVSSHYETFGLVAAEALMAGLPVVATRCGGPECIVLDGDGELVKAGDPRSLAIGMKKVAENLTVYDPEVLKERARARFSASAIAGRLTQEYEQVIGSYVKSRTSV